MCIFKCGLHLSHVQGWDRTSAYTGAAGSRYQSISDLTQPTQVDRWYPIQDIQSLLNTLYQNSNSPLL